MAALSGTTALLLLAVFTIVNIACLVLRRDPTPERAFRAPTVLPVIGAVCCGYLLGPWARLEADMVQYKIAAGLLAIILPLVLQQQRRSTSHTSVVERRNIDGGGPPVV